MPEHLTPATLAALRGLLERMPDRDDFAAHADECAEWVNEHAAALLDLAELGGDAHDDSHLWPPEAVEAVHAGAAERKRLEQEVERLRPDAELGAMLLESLRLEVPADDPRWGSIEVVNRMEDGFCVSTGRTPVSDTEAPTLAVALRQMVTALRAALEAGAGRDQNHPSALPHDAAGASTP